jgi:hypothetical protein
MNKGMRDVAMNKGMRDVFVAVAGGAVTSLVLWMSGAFRQYIDKTDIQRIAEALEHDETFWKAIVEKSRHLKIDSIRVLFRSTDPAKDDTLVNEGKWATETIIFNATDVDHSIDSDFGGRVYATWWVPRRGTNFPKWGAIEAKPNGNRILINGSAEDGASSIEAVVFVVHE